MPSLPIVSDREIIETGLRKAHKYIRAVEAWRKLEAERGKTIGLNSIVRGLTEGDEAEAIEAALLELGVIV